MGGYQSARRERSTRALAGRRYFQSLEDVAQVGKILVGQPSERRARWTSRMAEDVHRRLHYRDFEPAAALPQLVERPHHAPVVLAKTLEVAGRCQPVQLSRSLRPETRQ